MTPLRALVALELRSQLRDPYTWAGMGVIVLLSGATPAVRDGVLAVAGDERVAPGSRPPPPCAVADLPPIAVRGAWPAALLWSGPIDDEAPVAVVVTEREGVPSLMVVGASEDRDRVRDCARATAAAAAEARLAALGVSMSPVVGVEAAVPLAPPAPISLPGFAILSSTLLGAGSFITESLPMRRASGLMEQLRSTQATAAELVLAWLVVAVGFASAITMASGVVTVAAMAWWDGATPDGLLAAVHAWPFAALVAAITMRVSLSATDAASSSARFTLVMVAVLGGGLLAAGMPDWLAAMVPLGGSLLAGVGRLGAWAWLADAAALGWTAVVATSTIRAWDREVASAPGLDFARLRRARGDFLPEAITLAALALSAGVVGSLGAAAVSPGIGLGAASIGLMLIPAWLASDVLNVPRSELLPTARPRWVDVALAVPTTGGLISLAVWVVAASMWWLPDHPVFQSGQAMMAAVERPLDLLALAAIPALCEEALFRGAMLGLLVRGRPAWQANAIQALAFALAHGLVQRAPWTLTFGLIAGWIRLRTGSLWSSILVHFLFNGAMVAVALRAPSWVPADWLWPAAGGLLLLGALPLYGSSQEAGTG